VLQGLAATAEPARPEDKGPPATRAVQAVIPITRP
jgi:hypothetical protein